MENTCIYSSGNSGGSYIYTLEYNRYIESKIQNEESLIKQLGQYIPVNEAAYKNIRVVTEAKATDRIKNKMQKVVQFIKNLFGKFMESMTHILLDEKDYLEKYKDIILNKRPKDGMEYSYNGDYKVAIDRCINTTVPVFNYATHAEALKQEGDGPIVKLIMQNATGFSYDAGEDSLSTQFKEYFLATESDKESKGNFSELNFKDMYNFCYNFKKIETITKKDENYISQSTNAIINAANQQIKDKAAATTNPAPAASAENADGSAAPKPHEDSFRFASGTYFIEGTNDQSDQNGSSGQGNSGAQSGQQSGNDNQAKTNTELEVKDNSKNSNAVSQMGSTDRADIDDDMKKNNAAGSDNETENAMLEMGDKYTRVCQTLVAAKCTAVQQIAKDYMTIIRAHVRSYIGNTNDKKDNRVAQQSSDYQKNNKGNEQQGQQTQQPKKQAPKSKEQKEQSLTQQQIQSKIGEIETELKTNKNLSKEQREKYEKEKENLINQLGG